jgi:hypothetical protein
VSPGPGGGKWSLITKRHTYRYYSDDVQAHAPITSGTTASRDELCDALTAQPELSRQSLAPAVRRCTRQLAFAANVAMVDDMEVNVVLAAAAPDRTYLPSHVPSGAALLAIELSEEAHGIRGLDVLRRSVDRAPPGR